MANGMFKMKIDIDRHSPRLMPNNCQHLDPPYFSLPTTFNVGGLRVAGVPGVHAYIYPFISQSLNPGDPVPLM
jgi:hypothetical protein